MRPYSSRLEQKYERQSRQKIIFFLFASVVALVLVISVGLKGLFGLAGYISTLRRQPSKTTVADIIAPTTPRLAEDLTATSSGRMKLNGVADPRTTIEVWQNNRSLGTDESNSDGAFSWDVTLEKGNNTFTAVAISDAGSKSEPSPPYVVRFLSGNPKLDISGPKDGDTTKDSPVTVAGQTDPGNTVRVNDRLAIVTQDGKFAYRLDLNNGDNKIKIGVFDAAGNQTTQELTVKYQQ
jgi:bacillopeptidase F